MFYTLRHIIKAFLMSLFLLVAAYSQEVASEKKDLFTSFLQEEDVSRKVDLFFDSENRYLKTSASNWIKQLTEDLEVYGKQKDSSAVYGYNTILSQIYYDLGDYDKSIGISEELFEKNKKLEPELRIHLLHLMDNTYAALKQYDKQLTIRKEISKTGERVLLYDIYASLGLYRQALMDYMLITEPELEESDFFANAVYNNEQGNYLRLDGSYFSAIKKINLALSYINLYLGENRYAKSEKQFAEAVFLKGEIQGNLGKCYLALGRVDEAIPLLESGVSSVKDYHKGKFSVTLLELWANLADCYLKLESPRIAKRYLDSIALYKNRSMITDFDRLLAEYYLKIDDSDSASFYFKKYIQIKDSALANLRERELLGTLVNFDLDNQKATIEQQKKDIEKTRVAIQQRDKKINYSFIGLAVALLVSIIAIFAYFKSVKNKRVIEEQKSIIESSLAEKDSLLKEIHHRVKNNLQMVSSLLSMQTKNTRSKEAIAALEEGRSRVKAMALIHQKLYQNEDLSVIQMQEYIESLVNSVQSVYKKGGHKINIIIDAEGTELDIDRAIPIGLIINELVSNSLKYAFVGREDGQIYISVRLNGKLGVFEYLDNGNGLPDDVEKRAGSSLGIKLIERLVNQLRSTLNYDKDVDGVRFWFNFS
ncbi:sensor histidine kinase [Ascidiimonas aurantiaca]|uniref:sensor histidine kinase n=1 Tax=Ascidiimonas aurantiaca TaxID=1685432 RepID=UPI0030EE1A1F